MKSQDKRFYVIGLGSMGKRRIRNLLSLGYSEKQIFGFDIEKKRTSETKKKFRVQTISNFKDGLEKYKPTIFIICTPPDRHSDYFLFAAKNRTNFFCEISTVSRGYKQLMSLTTDSFVAAPSSTFRFFSPIKKIRELVEVGAVGKVLFFNLYLGQYLLDWHWYEDYRKVYFSRKETGGCKEMLLYEIIWLTYVFSSELVKIEGFKKKLSNLEIDTNDYYSTFLSFDNNVVGNLTIDLLNRKSQRFFSIIGTEGTLYWNWLESSLVIYKPGNKVRQIKLKKEDPHTNYNASEEMYRSELKAFIDAVDKKSPNPYSFDEDFKYLKLVENFSKQS